MPEGMSGGNRFIKKWQSPNDSTMLDNHNAFLINFHFNIMLPFPLSSTFHFAPTTVLLLPKLRKSAAEALNSLISFQGKPVLFQNNNKIKN
jgi:hypothetical protein